jgi:Uma2 family endonuclease
MEYCSPCSSFRPGFTVRPQLPLDLGQTTDPEPDIAVVRGTPQSHPTTPNTAEIIVEVSDSSLAFDLGDKAGLYAAAGIADYWVLDLANRRLHVLRDPRLDAALRFGHGYFSQQVSLPTDRVSALAAPQSSILVGDLLP